MSHKEDCTCNGFNIKEALAKSKRCNKEEYCKELQSILSESGGKGASVIMVMNTKTAKTRKLGVGYRRKSKDKLIMFNCCPFFEERIFHEESEKGC